MKTNRIFLYAAALMMAVACGKEAPVEPVIPDEDTNGEVVVTPQPEYAVSFTAYTEDAPDSKATIGTNSNNKPQTFWEDGDVISVYSSANMSTSLRSSYLFSTSLNQNSSSATFGYNGDDFEPGEKYMAIYPHREGTRVVNFTAQPENPDPASAKYEGDAYRMAMVVIPQSQNLVAGGFDKTAAVAVAVSDGSSLHFKNATALIKFQVEGTDILTGSVVASDPITGTFRCDILASDGTPMMMTYTQPNSTRLDFSINSTTPLSPATDYYVAVRPTDLSDGFEFYLSGVLIKKYEIEKFERNKIYDLGTLKIPEGVVVENTKKLVFGFQNAPASAGLDSWLKTNAPADIDKSAQVACTYVLDGEKYEFILTNPLEASKNFPYFNTNRLTIPTQRYVGLPVVEGYKLTEVSFLAHTVGTKIGIATEVATSTNDPTFVEGGTAQKVDYFNLTNTAADTRYWIKAYGAYALYSLTLTYTEAE